MKLQIRLIIVIIFLGAKSIHAQNQILPEIIDVGIFSGESIRKFSFMPLNGKYMICNQNHEKLLEVFPLTTLVLEVNRNGFTVSRNDTLLFSETHILLQGAGFFNSFALKPLQSDLGVRAYDGDLKISLSRGTFRLINMAPFESYVAGTVQWESGFNRHNVFYQVQAIIIRTYALRNIKRHTHEGFHLCDKVHCQAYYGKTNDPSIIRAVYQSRGEVLTDLQGNLLNTVYHANCGGQTVNSEDLWPEALPYLRSNPDPYCQDMPGARWEKSITVPQLTAFLRQRFRYTPEPATWDQIIRLQQNNRVHHLDPGKVVHLKHMREFFNLRSTFFSMQIHGDTLHLQGKGYGHGVGLCQEGAMQRAVNGHSREEILKFYYQGAAIQLLEPIVEY